MTEPLPYPGTPRWVKAFGIVAIGLVLLLALIAFTGFGGPHGPGRHVLQDEAAGRMPPANAIQPGK